MRENTMGISTKKMSFFTLLILVAGIINPSFGQVSLAQQRTVPSCAKYPTSQCLLTSKLRAIVLGNFTYGFNHTVGYPNLDSTITRIGRTETPAWTVGHMTAGTQVTAAALANYQVFLANYISGFGGGRTGGLAAASQLALQNFVEVSGNGMFLMHSSGDSPLNASWPWYSNVVHPCHYNGEAGAGQAASVGRVGVWSQNNKAAKSHPIMEGIGWGGANPDSLVINPGMELHTFDKAITNNTITPVGWQGLLGLNAPTCGTPNTCSGNAYNYTTAGGPMGWPISWTFPDMKGAIGYFMEGHDLNTMNSFTRAIWDRYFKQMMYYLAGYDTTSVTSIGPSSHQEFNLDRSGISFHYGEPGVLITTPGSHLVSICDIAGHEIKALRGNQSPVDYNFSEEIKGAGRGIYVVRVAVAGGVKSKRFIVN